LSINENLKLLTGNEAIARSAYEAGVKFASAYPGTPSTEILENFAKYSDIYCQWSVNEKVAMEVGSGASMAGARTLVAMKHVGLNVAADPFMTLAYTGVGAGLVVISADDPHMHSSQNEQDNRFYAKFAKVPMLEPTDSQEALDLVKAAYNISEDFDTPVLIRTTTRISHSRSIVKIGQRTVLPVKKYVKDSCKYVMIPSHARIRHHALIERYKKLKKYCEDPRYYDIYIPPKPPKGTFAAGIGIITSGIPYQYAREIFDGLPILKLKMTNPLPENTIREFARNKRLILVIEELDPFLEEQIKLILPGIAVAGKEYFPEYGELSLNSMEKVHSALFGTDFFTGQDEGNINLSANSGADAVSAMRISGQKSAVQENSGQKSAVQENLRQLSIKKLLYDLPPRPPVLCAGCGHRSVFYILKKLKVAVMGDIGCYTLAVLPPLNSMDSTLCMGAGVGQALGMEKADPGLKNKVVSVIGDSTFFHSGITPLIDNFYNSGAGLIIILDNGTTAMTGHQVNPGVGKTLMGNDAVQIKPEAIAKAVGIKHVRVVDPYNLKKLEKILREELARNELSVIVCRRICALLQKKSDAETLRIDSLVCRQCGVCMKFGCPAIELRDGSHVINSSLCTNCEVCVDVCKYKAINAEKKINSLK
jgi:indolepyruvate ferredoxin oxidoreductase alpha subunit